MTNHNTTRNAGPTNKSPQRLTQRRPSCSRRARECTNHWRSSASAAASLTHKDPIVSGICCTAAIVRSPRRPLIAGVKRCWHQKTNKREESPRTKRQCSNPSINGMRTSSVSRGVRPSRWTHKKKTHVPSLPRRRNMEDSTPISCETAAQACLSGCAVATICTS